MRTNNKGRNDYLARKAATAAEKADMDFIAVASTAEGQRFLWRLMSDCGVFSSIWHPSAQIHFNEGKRNVGLFVLTELNRLCPERYLEMVNSKTSDIRKEAATLAAVEMQSRSESQE